MQTILVTGCAGFIGMHVTKALLERGDKIIGIDNLNNYYSVSLKEARLKELKKFPNFWFHKQDLSEGIKIQGEEKIDCICHLGAQAGVRYSLENPVVYEKSNSMGTLHIFEFARNNNIQNVVFASSSSVYGHSREVPFKETHIVERPVSFYAATKKSNELYAHAYSHLYGIKMTGLRFFTVYGPWGRPDMAPYIFTEKILKEEEINVFHNGDMIRDFTYVDDIVQGVLGAIDNSHKHSFEIINLARGEPIKLMDFIRGIEEATNKKAKINFMPLQKGDVLITSGDINKAREIFGYEPKTSIKDGLREFVKWYKEYHQIN